MCTRRIFRIGTPGDGQAHPCRQAQQGRDIAPSRGWGLGVGVWPHGSARGHRARAWSMVGPTALDNNVHSQHQSPPQVHGSRMRAPVVRRHADGVTPHPPLWDTFRALTAHKG